MAGVIFDRVNKCYGDTEVIRELNLEIRDQEFMVLVGPSGCGKSTALRMIAGLEEITGGQIRIGDRVVNNVAPKDRDIAMVFQSYALYPHMSVRENMDFGLRLKKMDRGEMDQRIDEASRILGIEKLLERRPKHLSGGQRQRVAVGRAIVRQPSVFLFDEPLSNLDAKLRVQMRAEITGLQHRLKTTTIYVTHDQVEAMTMGHRIAVLHDGDLQQVGTPLELYETPRNLFVARFIGTPPMNFFRATIADDGARLTADGVELPVHDSLRRITQGRSGKEVMVGIRPENLYDVKRQTDHPTARIRLKVALVETLGHEVLVHGHFGSDERETDPSKLLVGKVDPHSEPELNQEIEMQARLDSLHLYDPETEARLGEEGE
ncbi:sn-glycerol-3-phosphate ABC transporter ATP-binding protein UgpC [bacterium]|nr:sn-glycerol-3-phosphate ABC transporter ATP-binding protein UgpC [bacterium]